MFVGKARSLHLRGAPEKCFTQVSSSLTRKHQTTLKSLPGTNTAAGVYFMSMDAQTKSPTDISIFISMEHRYLRMIDRLMAHTTGLVCLISTVSGCSKKR